MPTYNENLLPASTGFDLGSTAQRWDANLRNVDVAGAQTIAGTTATTNAGVFSGSQMTGYVSSLVGGIVPQTEFQRIGAQPGQYATDAAEFGISVPSGATIHQADAISAFANSSANSSGRTVANTTAAYLQAFALGTGAAVWGVNPLVSDAAGVSGSNLTAIEADVNVWGTPSFVRGLDVILGGTGTMPADSTAIEIATSSLKWNTGIRVDRSATNGIGVLLDGATSSNNVNSQAIEFIAYDSGGVAQKPSIQANPSGAIQLQPASGNAAFVTNGGGLNLGGTVGLYNNIATVAGGMAPIYAQYNSGAQTGAVTPTIYAIPASGQGMYELSYVLTDVVAGTGSSTATLSFTWNDTLTVKTQTITVPANFLTSTSNQLNGVIAFIGAAATNVSASANVATTTGSPSYALYVRLKFLG